MTKPATKSALTSRANSAVATVAIIGAINRDEVWDMHGKKRGGWGGILYNIAALARFTGSQTRILPIAHLGTDARRPVGTWLNHIPQVDCSALVPWGRPGNLCQMRYLDPDRRKEKLLHRVPSLSYGVLRKALKADVALVNFISGNDVTPSALERIRREFRGIIYMDIHSYLLGRRRDAGRFARRPSGWHRIVSCADVLQMNQVEFATLSGQIPDPQMVRDWVDSVLTSLRCRCLLVTLGANGAFCVTRTRGRWQLRHFVAGRRAHGFDPTGCGDTFSGLWLSACLDGRDPMACAQIAARGAARPLRPAV